MVWKVNIHCKVVEWKANIHNFMSTKSFPMTRNFLTKLVFKTHILLSDIKVNPILCACRCLTVGLCSLLTSVDHRTDDSRFAEQTDTYRWQRQQADKRQATEKQWSRVSGREWTTQSSQGNLNEQTHYDLL